jgi:transcriptional regulator with XRE-family HTH domain
MTAALDPLPPPGYDPGMPTPPEPDSPAARLRAARDRAGLSQGQAAAKMPGNVTIQYWSDVERGRRSPSLEWLWDAAHAIGCDPNTLDDRLRPARPPKRRK